MKKTRTAQGAKADLSVVVEKRSEKSADEDEYSLDKLLAGVRKSNLHGEVETGNAVGREVW